MLSSFHEFGRSIFEAEKASFSFAGAQNMSSEVSGAAGPTRALMLNSNILFRFCGGSRRSSSISIEVKTEFILGAQLTGASFLSELKRLNRGNEDKVKGQNHREARTGIF